MSYGPRRYEPDSLVAIKQFFADNKLKGGWMLDMGCGYGYYSHIGADFYDNIVAVDINQNSVAEAKKRLKDPRIIVELGKIETYSTNQRFDLILCLVMCRRRHPTTRINVKTIGNMVKLLSKDGVLIIDVWNISIKNIKKAFNIQKIAPTIELPDHIVKSQSRLHIKR